MASKHSFKKTRHNLYEKQKFSNIYILLMLLIAEGACLYFCIIKVFAHRPFIFSTFDYWPLLIFTLLIPTPLLFAYYFIRLDTIYNDDGIFYRWAPFAKNFRMIQWDAIREISLVDLKSAGSIRNSSKDYDKVHYLGSGLGVIITMKSGKKRLIGTKKAEALNRILIRLAGENYKPSNIAESIDYSDD
jgi:hypothetical protein